MNVTEVLITGYEGEAVVFAISTSPGRARTILTTRDSDGELRVDSVLEVVTPAFGSLLQILGSLGAFDRPSTTTVAK